MSNRLIKSNGSIQIPNDEIILLLEVTKSGKMNLQAPSIHPSVVCKMLFGIVVDLMYSSFQMQDNRIIAPEKQETVQ